MQLTMSGSDRKFAKGGRMKDIHEVLRRKQAKYAQLGKQIEMLQQAAEKLREVAPLLAENEDDDSAVLSEMDEQPGAKAAAAGAGSGAGKPRSSPRWP
ncbi:MAG: hypothetical protein WAL32_05485 [Terriglobales bacterium]